MQNRYVLFGAGITGMATLRYYGRNAIAAVIDNDPKKVGGIYEGIPVISFETYLKDYKDLTIIVSIYSKNYFECVEQMKGKGVTNYFTSPPVIYGFDTPEEFAENNVLRQSGHIVFYGSNPITERIEAYIRGSEAAIDYIDNGLCRTGEKHNIVDINNLKEEDTLVLTTNEVENPVRTVLEKKFSGKVVDIYQYQEERKGKYVSLEKYKNLYKGKRCFVIGNGPSLRQEDLMVLERNGEISFASNGIFHIYDRTSWRPTHYMVCDMLCYKAMYQEIKKIENEEAFIVDYSHVDCERPDKAKRFYMINKLYTGDRFGFSDDAVKGFYSGRTVTYVMIQMACYMGISEIYLLGVDWTGGKGTGVGRIDFYEGEQESIANSSRFDLFTEEKYAFETARDYAETHGIKIYNATRGGELEVFERVNFDCLFGR